MKDAVTMRIGWKLGERVTAHFLSVSLSSSFPAAGMITTSRAEGEQGHLASGEGNGNALRHSCLGNVMDRGAWWATVHRIAEELDTT